MSVTDVLETQFKLDASQYKREAGSVNSVNSGLDANFGKLAGALAGLKVAGGIAAAAIAAVGVAGSAAFAAYKQFAAFESLENSLLAVEGSAQKAAKAMRDLKEIAKAPGIGMEEAVRGYAGLRRGGFGNEQSKQLVSEAGNANAFAGGNVESFSRMMYAFTQILGKPYLQGEELMQLNEAGLPASKIIREKFGTSDGGKLEKMEVTSVMALEALLEAMAKLPRVAGGAQNSIDNLGDAVKFATIAFGREFKDTFSPALNAIGTELSLLEEEGYFQDLAQSLKDMADAFAGQDLGESIKTFAGAIKVIADTGASASNFLRDVYEGILRIQDFFKFIPGTVAWARAMQKAQEERGTFDGGMENARKENEAGWKAMGYDVEQILKEQAARQKERDKANAKTEEQKTLEQKKAEEQKKADDLSTQVLRKIETNTAKMLDIQKAAFGGGELARVGVTATEIRGKSNREKLAHQIGVVGLDMAFPVMRQTRRLGT
jgi:tape measure domain-containing protein